MDEKIEKRKEIKKEKLIRLPHEISRFIYVRNLPHKITPEELYDIFGRFGIVRQIRRGILNKNKGTAFVVYEDLMDAKRAVEKLKGINVLGKYLICLYFNQNKEKNKEIENEEK